MSRHTKDKTCSGFPTILTKLPVLSFKFRSFIRIHNSVIFCCRLCCLPRRKQLLFSHSETEYLHMLQIFFWKTAVKLPTSTECISDSSATKAKFKKECCKNILHIFKIPAQEQLLHYADCMLRNICPLGLSLHGKPDLQVQYNTMTGRMQTGFTPTRF